MSASDWRSKAESLRSEARQAVSAGNEERAAGREERAQDFWRYASQLEMTAQVYEERANQEENAAR